MPAAVLKSRAARGPLLVLASALVLLASCAHFVNYRDPAGPVYEGSFAPRPDPEPALRVVTFNVAYAIHIDRAIALLTEDPHLRDADLVFLQEMDAPGTRRIAEAMSMHYLYYPAAIHPKTDRDFGNAILSRWPIREPRKILLPHSARLVHSQRATTSGIVHLDTLPVRVYSVHIATQIALGGKDRRDQLRTILDDTGDTPGRVIIAGDFNSHGLGEFFANTGFDWPSRRVGSTSMWFDLDQIFTRGFRLAAPEGIGVIRDNRDASDHRPVWAVFVPDTLRPLPRGGYRFARADSSMPIKRFAWVDSALARGGRPDRDGVAALARRHFRTVIDFTGSDDVEREAKAAGIGYVPLPMTAHLWSSPPTDEQVDTFFRTVLDPAKQPVYMHCRQGRDRTGMMAALYRIEVQGWSVPAAIEEMQLLGYHDWYDDLIDYVRGYTPRGYGPAAGGARLPDRQ
jgi:endonuclease/exonuclease/phosphatase family metal-dependent hydrolase/protein tyrosine phosphatase (PTP) superfamily phosphohydrolase (DUF442 family)